MDNSVRCGTGFRIVGYPSRGRPSPSLRGPSPPVTVPSHPVETRLMTAPRQAPNPAAHRIAVPWTVRVAGWSARHRWLVFVLWFVGTIGIFVASLAAGGTDSAEAVSNDERAKYEVEQGVSWSRTPRTRRARGGGPLGSSSCWSSSNPDATVDDPGFAAAIADIVARLGALQTTVEGTTRAGPRAARRPDDRAAIGGPRVPRSDDRPDRGARPGRRGEARCTIGTGACGRRRDQGRLPGLSDPCAERTRSRTTRFRSSSTADSTPRFGSRSR